jgi:hypothetical protein
MSSIAKLKSAALGTGGSQIFTLNTPHDRIQVTWKSADTDNPVLAADTITITFFDEDGDEITATDIYQNDADGVYAAGAVQMAVFEAQFLKVKVLYTDAAVPGDEDPATCIIKVKTYAVYPPPSPSWRPYQTATASPQELKTDYV